MLFEHINPLSQECQNVKARVPNLMKMSPASCQGHSFEASRWKYFGDVLLGEAYGLLLLFLSANWCYEDRLIVTKH